MDNPKPAPSLLTIMLWMPRWGLTLEVEENRADMARHTRGVAPRGLK